VTEVERRALRTLVARLVRAVDGVIEPGAEVLGAGAAIGPELAAAVRRHMLGPLAHRAGWPGFRGDHAAATIQADRRAAVLAEAVAALGQAGIRVLLLKGAAYAGTLYPEAALRPMSDLDLMVSGTEYGRAIAALQRLGYWHTGTREQLSAPNHAFTLKRRDGSIDVHRHITHAGRTSIDLEAVWRDARPAEHVPGALRASAVHEYLIHVAHMARHELGVPAVNLVDAARLRARAGTLLEVEALARRWRISRGLRAAEGLLADVGDGENANRHGFLPSIEDVLAERRGRRIVQIARKLFLTDDLRGVVALGAAAVRGQLEHLRSRG
jgi:Uncharacterised nucleotidyltransferase